MRKILLSVLILALATLLAGCTMAPLEQAAWRGDLNTAKILLDSGADPNEKKIEKTALTLAILKEHFDIVKLLIEKGADVNQPAIILVAGNSDTPLVVAASRGNFKITNLLLEKGANLDYALNICEQRSAGIGGPMYQSCLATLKAIKAEHDKEVSQPARSQGVSKEELQNIVQAAVEGSKKPTPKTSGIATELEKPIFSESEKIMTEHDLAVIIGIEGYQSLPKSDYSYDDAKLVGDYVKALGFKPRNIEMLLDERATKSAIEKTIKTWLLNKAKPNSRVFVYYSGHGAPDPSTGEAYIVPFDGDPNYLTDTGYSLKNLYASLGKLQAAEVTVVLDSCFSGAGGRSVLAKGARPLVMMAETTALPSNIAVLSSTQGSQISSSSPEKGHGIFTYYFLKAIKDGKKDLAGIYEYIKPLVEDEAKGQNVNQSPSLNPEPGKVKGMFALRK